jgi:hypothetical protein
MTGHRPPIMSDKNAVMLSGNLQNLRVTESGQNAIRG